MDYTPRVAASTLSLLIRFGSVGAAATVTYFAATIVFVEWAALSPNMASIIGMALGFAVSYLGQHSFTFRARAAHH